MDVISKIAVQLINWKFGFNWHINWKFNWFINSQLKPAVCPTINCKLLVNFDASLWMKCHPAPWSYHGSQKMLRSSLADLLIARLPAQRAESAFHLPGVELLPINQIQTTHLCLGNFNNKHLGLSAVKIDRDLCLIRYSFYCFKIAHCQWGNG